MLDDNFWPPAEAFLDLSSMSQLTDGQARCPGVAVCDEEGRATQTFQPGQWAHFFYEFEALKEIGVPMAALECQDEGGCVFQAPNIIRIRRDATERRILDSVPPGTWLYYHHIIHLKVGPGKYFFTVRLSLPDTGNPDRPDLGGQGNHLVHEYCRAIHAGSFTVVRELEQVVQTARSTTDQRPQPAPQLESRSQVLLAQLEEKQQVIYDLDATAEERLQLINRLKEEMKALSAQLEEKQQVIHDLHATA